MAAFAKIGLNNKVMEVLSVHDNELLDSNGVSHESIGISFLTNLTGWAIWKQSFEDGSSRKNFASINYSYDETRDAFIPPKPYPSWTLNETTCRWKAPTPYPGENYRWNEETLTWENNNG
tara:strand:+ start:1316 stop:1675 length:360 start_codon:yes stop_codon:yes gene_type:complete